MTFFTHRFEAPILSHNVGNRPKYVTYRVVVLPEAMQEELPFDKHPRLRIDGEIADFPFNGAWQPVGNGRYYLIVPKQLFSELNLKVGDHVDVRFRIADQNAVDVPDALRRALLNDPELQSKWNQLTAGKRRSFSRRVATAKTEATIEKRIVEVTHMIRNDLTYGKGGKIT
ncbi:MAG: YdeI/OmpD-associated family protein [Pseudomonadota bacterium]